MSRTAVVVWVLVAIMAVAGLSRLQHKTNEQGAATAPAAAVRNRPAAYPNNESKLKLIPALVPKRAPMGIARPPQFPLRAPRDQPDQVVAEVRPAAEAGDVAAMRILGEELNKCAHADMRSDDEIEAAAAKWSIDLEYAKKHGIGSFVNADLPKMAAGLSNAKERLRDSCRKIPAEDLYAAGVWSIEQQIPGTRTRLMIVPHSSRNALQTRACPVSSGKTHDNRWSKSSRAKSRRATAATSC